MSNQPRTGKIRSFRFAAKPHELRTTLARSPILGFDVLIVRNGGTLACDGDDAVESAYLILEGEAHLTDDRGATNADLGALEGVHFPRGASGRLESTSEDDLVLLGITAMDPRPASDHLGALHAPLRTFRYESPHLGDKLIAVPYLVEQKDMLGLSVEKVRDGGGDDVFHTHSGTDSVWYSLGGGRSRFRSPDGSQIVIESGEGVFIPHMAAYGFAALDPDPAEVLHVKVRDLSVPNERIDY